MTGPVFLRALPVLLAIIHPGLHAAEVFPDKVNVVIGEGFQLRLIQKTPILDICQLVVNQKKYPLDTSHILPSGEHLEPLDTADSATECGVRVFNASEAIYGFWEIAAGNDSSLAHKASLVTVVDPVHSPCAIDPYSCSQVEEESIKSRQCSENACDYWTNGKMDKDTMRIISNTPARAEIKAALVLASGALILECTADFVIEKCFIEHKPSGERFLIQDGLQHSRYSAHNTSYSAGRCQFEIPAGGVQENEAGLWRMTLFKSSDNPLTSCDFYLAAEKSAEELQKRTQSVVEVRTIRQHETIECVKDSYYPLRLCYLVQTELVFNRNISDGNCVFSVPAGNWTCGFNGPTEQDNDLQQQFQVVQFYGETIEGAVKVTNESTTIECHLYNRQAINLCMIKAPSGKIFRPPTDQFKTEEFSYYGGGRMATGDCGVEFKGQAVPLEEGDWECIIGRATEDGDKVLPPIAITVESNEVHADASV